MYNNNKIIINLETKATQVSVNQSCQLFSGNIYSMFPCFLNTGQICFKPEREVIIPTLIVNTFFIINCIRNAILFMKEFRYY